MNVAFWELISGNRGKRVGNSDKKRKESKIKGMLPSNVLITGNWAQYLRKTPGDSVEHAQNYPTCGEKKLAEAVTNEFSSFTD